MASLSSPTDCKPWVSASETRNYALHDPVIDYFKQVETIQGASLPNPVSTFEEYLFENGNIFEQKILQQIKEKIGSENVKTIVEKIDVWTEELRYHYYIHTLKEMTLGVPVIYQGVLLDMKERLFGIPDFLIRSDVFEQITNQALKKSKHKNTYVVVDVKWSTIELCSNSETVLNQQSTPAFKCQLAFYNLLLKNTKHFHSDRAFIIGKRWNCKSEGKSSKSPLDHPPCVDFESNDKNYVSICQQAIDWLRDVKTHFKEWTLTPPSRTELYPNMKNSHDGRFHSKKLELAKSLGEITLVWNCGYQLRNDCHSKNITSWWDPRFKEYIADSTLSEDRKQIILNMVEVNTRAIPIKGNIKDTNVLKVKDYSDVFIDFEFSHHLSSTRPQSPIIYACAVGTKINTILTENRILHVESFVAPRFSDEGESQLFSNLCKYLTDHMAKYNLQTLRFIHWGHAERTCIERFLSKVFLKNMALYSRVDYLFKNMDWLDLCSYLQSQKVVIQGAFSYGLKDVGKALHQQKRINTIWKDLDSTLDSLFNVEKIDNVCQTMGIVLKDSNEMQKIIEYNKIDIYVTFEIISSIYSFFAEKLAASHTMEVKNISGTKITFTRTSDRKRKLDEANMKPDTKITKNDAESTLNHVDLDDDIPIIQQLTLVIPNSSGTPVDKVDVPITDDESDNDDGETINTTESERSVDSDSVVDSDSDVSTTSNDSNDSDSLYSLSDKKKNYISIEMVHRKTLQHNVKRDLTDFEDEELKKVEEVLKQRKVDTERILHSKLSLEEKCDLLEKMNIMNGLPTLSAEWYEIRDHVYHVLHDSEKLSGEEQHLLQSAMKPGDNYIQRIAESHFDTATKVHLVTRYKKANTLRHDDPDRQREYEILEYSLQLPKPSPTIQDKNINSTMRKTFEYLNKNIYGMKDVKEEFLLYMLDMMTLKREKSNIIGLTGSPGVGKSTFANSIGVSFDIPTYRINMGGISDSGTLIGTLPSYIGSDIGLLTRALIECKTETCVIVLEEIDKISKTRYGEEISHLLAHVLDPSFNNHIVDKFLGIPINLRNVIFVATMNDTSEISPVIRNRIRMFEIPDPTREDKKNTCQQILLPKLYERFGFTPENVIFDSDVLKYIVDKSADMDKGFRTIETTMTTVLRKLFAMKTLDPATAKALFRFVKSDVVFPLKVTPEIVDNLSEERKKDDKKWYAYTM
jgi:ATP-dependent Lon protease